MTAPLRLRLLGGFQLRDATGKTVSLNLRKAQALLAYLAVSAGQSAPRETLAGLLWGEFEQQRARQSLRQALLALTKALARSEGPVLRMESHDVSLVPGALAVDVVEFEGLIAEGSPSSLATAAALYGGEFVPGLRLDAPDFEDWLSATRGRLRDLALKALVDLLTYQEGAGEFCRALVTAKQALRIDPYREDLHRRLMGLYVRQDMRSSALAQYGYCREILSRELGVKPDEATTRLYQEIRRQEHMAAVPPPASVPAPRIPAAPSGGAVAAHYRALVGQLGTEGPIETALASVLRGARLEMKRGAWDSARQILDQALPGEEMPRAAGQPHSLEIDIHLLRATLAESGGDVARAGTCLAAAEGLAERLSDRPRLTQCLLARARLLERTGEHEAAVGSARRGLTLARHLEDDGVWLEQERLLARLHLIGPRGEAMIEQLKRRAERHEALGLIVDAAETVALLTVARALGGDLVAAAADAQRALDLAETAACKVSFAAALEAQGLVRLWREDFEAARASFGKALTLAEARGDLPRCYLLGGFAAVALLATGRHEEGLAGMDRALTLAARLGTRFLVPCFKAWAAEAACRRGGRGDLLALGREAFSRATAANQPWAASIASRALALAALRADPPDLHEARRSVKWALDTQSGLGLTFEVARSRRVQARVREAQRGNRVAPADGDMADLPV